MADYPVTGSLNWAGNLKAYVDEGDEGSAAGVAADLAAHIADTTDAHDASAISTIPAGSLAATNVQTSLAELDSEKASTDSVTTVSDDLAAHLADTVDAHDASAISFVPAGTIAATTVQAAIEEVSGDVTSLSTTQTINAQTGTSYTLVLTDAGKFVTMTNAAASTLTVPPNSSVAFPVGTVIEGAQLGAGQVTLTPGSGVTISAAPGLKATDQNSVFGLIKMATDTWLAFGRLSA